MTTLYCARWVAPISSSVIENGAVAVSGPSIAAVGLRSELALRFPQANTKDFGEAIIIPGLINAHTHLELTVMRGFLEAEEHDFFAWLRKLTLARLALSSDDILQSATWGAIEAARAGVTCVADASDSASESMQALKNVGLRGIVYQESFGPDPQVAGENFAKLQRKVETLRASESSLVRAGVSPHSPYTVSARQLELISAFASQERLPLMMHAAESQAEYLLLKEGRGAFADSLQQRGIEWQAPGISPIQFLAEHGVLETKPLLAHCIIVDDADLTILKETGTGIAHCPKSNAKLGHGYASYAKFLEFGLNVGIGSDSVASNNTCDILEEARFATLLSRAVSKTEDERRQATAEAALFAATLGGARALGIDKQTGALTEGLQADLAIIALDRIHQRPVRDPIQALIFSSSARDVMATVVAGSEIYRDGAIDGFDEKELHIKVEAIRSKMGN
ncbi:MAG: aminodeoxyfutalosine deaminase [Blastocatellia bacterium]|jgi:5-methylthioadenosine/S-adenosylhomocysteine deaminase|nr:aminodeoxyfutalosine deaminase [Blastocatellia bacterium]